MSSPAPVKPPRGMKQQGRETSGLLMSVIRTLSASETNEQRDREKAKLEKEYNKCDQKLDELVSQDNTQLTQVMQVFGNVSSIVSGCRARVQGARARLAGCKQLLRGRRSELRRLCTEGAQHRHALHLLQQIEQLAGVGAELSGHLSRKNYLNAATVLQAAICTAQTNLCQVEALQHFRTDMETKRQLVYDRVLTELNETIYEVNFEEIGLKRQGSSRRPELPRLTSTQSEDGYLEVSPQFELTLVMENKTPKITLAILIESLAVIDKLKESTESAKVQMQTELLQVISTSCQYVLDNGTSQLPSQVSSIGNLLSNESEVSRKDDLEASAAQPLVELMSLLLDQFRLIAERQELLIEAWKHSIKRHNLKGVHVYNTTYYWSRVQAVLQLILTDYLDVQSLKSGPQRMIFQEQTVNIDINVYFTKKKTQSKKKSRLFKFSGSSVKESAVVSAASRGQEPIADSKGYKLVCLPAHEHLPYIYHMLDDFMDDIERSNSVPECSLRVYLGELVRGAQAERTALRLREQVSALCGDPTAWRELRNMPVTPTKNRTLFKCAMLSWECCASALSSALKLRSLGAVAACGALSPALNFVHASAKRRTQQHAPRARSHVWLVDQDITRFLKSLPNWNLLKNPPVKGKRDQVIVAEDLKRSFEREAEILGSSLGDGTVSEKEIITNISTLRDIAIMCETMDWLSVNLKNCKVNTKLQSSGDPKINGVTSSPSVANKSKHAGSFEALSNELNACMLSFEDLADNCLLLLHLEVRMQCFHYLGRLGGSLGLAPKASLTPSASPRHQPSHLGTESHATALAKTLHAFCEHVGPVLHHRKLNYIMEGLGEMMSAVIVAGWRGGTGAAEAAPQLEPLRHCLTAAQVSSDGLHKAALYLQMLNMTHQEILSMVSLKGASFSELEYINAFQVIAKTSNLPDTVLNSNLHKLSNILGNVGVTV